MKLLYSLVLTLFCFTIAYAPLLPLDAAVVNHNAPDFVLKSGTTPLTSGSLARNELLVKGQDYDDYPQIASYTTASGSARNDELRWRCDASSSWGNALTKMPWIAYYPTTEAETGRPSEYESNHFDSYRNCVDPNPNRLNHNRMNGGVGHFMPKEMLGGWATIGERDTGWSAPIVTTDLMRTIKITSGLDLVWKDNSPAPSASYDAEPLLFGSKHPENVDLDLKSSGVTYVRMEFDFTDEQWAHINANGTGTPDYFSLGVKYKADDFVKTYVNGYTEAGEGIYQNTVTPADANTPNNSLTVKATSRLFQKTGNVVAFQVIDKAVWHKSGAQTSANAAGLWFEITGDFTTTSTTVPDPTLSCTVTPQEGLAPLVITATTTATNYNPAPTLFDYKFQRIKDSAGEAVTNSAEVVAGRGTELYYTLPNAGTYNAWTSIAGANNYVPCDPIDVVVTDPTDPDGGEVAP